MVHRRGPRPIFHVPHEKGRQPAPVDGGPPTSGRAVTGDGVWWRAMQRRQLERVRLDVLHLHKAIIDDAREQAERVEGRISAHLFVDRLMTDPAFAWLRPLNAMIVAMDEWLDARDAEPEVAAGLAGELRQMLAPDPEGDAFQRQYHDLLQRNPTIILAHAAAVRLLGPR